MINNIAHTFWLFYLISTGAAMLLLLPSLLEDINATDSFWVRKKAFLWSLVCLLSCFAWPILLGMGWWTGRKRNA